eukprot:COSAG01_NODE_4843_length_4689_cov_21.961874_2_plen_202_part_00
MGASASMRFACVARLRVPLAMRGCNTRTQRLGCLGWGCEQCRFTAGGGSLLPARVCPAAAARAILVRMMRARTETQHCTTFRQSPPERPQTGRCLCPTKTHRIRRSLTAPIIANFADAGLPQLLAEPGPGRGVIHDVLQQNLGLPHVPRVTEEAAVAAEEHIVLMDAIEHIGFNCLAVGDPDTTVLVQYAWDGASLFVLRR